MSTEQVKLACGPPGQCDRAQQSERGQVGPGNPQPGFLQDLDLGFDDGGVHADKQGVQLSVTVAVLKFAEHDRIHNDPFTGAGEQIRVGADLESHRCVEVFRVVPVRDGAVHEDLIGGADAHDRVAGQNLLCAEEHFQFAGDAPDVVRNHAQRAVEDAGARHAREAATPPPPGIHAATASRPKMR